MTSVPEEERFKANAVILADAIHSNIVKMRSLGYQTIDPTTVIIAKALLSSIDSRVLIQGFIEGGHDKDPNVKDAKVFIGTSRCWDAIKERNEKFFVDNSATIFGSLPMGTINIFKDLFLAKDSQGMSVIPQEMKNDIWGLLDALVKISIKYVHRERKPRIDNQGQVVYTASFMEHANVPRLASIWGIKLDTPMSL